ncbi:MAG: hypothetical protein ACHQNT_10890 [Bacteroidia bacterium]
MKKLFLSVFVAGTLLTATQAQTRYCGTMEYYELRKQQDPSLEKKMEENEKQIAKWIKEHPAQGVSEKAVLPPLPGFKISGNEKRDKINYAIAKSKYLADHGLLDGNKIPADINNDKSLREKKRKSNSFITKN